MLNEFQNRLARGLLANAALLVVSVALWILTCCIPACQHPAHAQDDRTVRTLLVQFVAEADFDAPSDHAAIGHAMQRRARAAHITLDREVRAYSSVFHHAMDHDPRARWVRELRVSCKKPPHWPKSQHWSHTACMHVVARARALLAGRLGDPCPRSRHFGGAMDSYRARRAGWKRARCSKPTANLFWEE